MKVSTNLEHIRNQNDFCGGATHFFMQRRIFCRNVAFLCQGHVICFGHAPSKYVFKSRVNLERAAIRAAFFLHKNLFNNVIENVDDNVITRINNREIASPGVEKCTVGAYDFAMLKKQESSATRENRGPAAGGQSRGETLSKQVYLGRF